MVWKTVERPGYLGKKRDEVRAMWNKQYGEGKWRLAYQWGDAVISRLEAIRLYEDAYVDFLKKNPKALRWIVKNASDVYDTAPTNVNSGFDYTMQETPNSHIHDIAIRRAVLRCGEYFEGDHLVHVRWTGSEGLKLNPGKVLFHKPEMICREPLKDYGGKGTWWEPLTIEDFYQRNKVLQALKE